MVNSMMRTDYQAHREEGIAQTNTIISKVSASSQKDSDACLTSLAKERRRI